jgi:hypothetical protein
MDSAEMEKCRAEAVEAFELMAQIAAVNSGTAKHAIPGRRKRRIAPPGVENHIRDRQDISRRRAAQV